jgi:hypothetical protein
MGLESKGKLRTKKLYQISKTYLHVQQSRKIQEHQLEVRAGGVIYDDEKEQGRPGRQ